MSADSTAFYRDLLYSQSDLSHKQILLEATDFTAINNLLPKPSDALQDMLKPHLMQLRSVDHLLVPNITIHETLDRLFPLPDTRVSLVHPLKLTIKQLQKKKIDRVLLIGSKYTMQPGYISNAMLAAGITCQYPEPPDIDQIDRYRRSIYNREDTPAMSRVFMNLLESYSQDLTVILACTEFSMVYDGSKENIMDMARVQVESLKTQ